VEPLEKVVPQGKDLPELALRFILQHPAVSTVIPGMRRVTNVQRNMRVSDGVALSPQIYSALRAHRWDRTAIIP
jgi:aryl-alcohol dehydrogenase-like predicted oxidoreductase